AVQLTAERHAVDGDHAVAARVGSDDLARIEPVVWIEETLDSGQYRIEPVAEEIARELAAVALAMLAPEQTAVALDQGRHLLGDGAQPLAVGRILHVQRRAHVQAAYIHV